MRGALRQRAGDGRFSDPRNRVVGCAAYQPVERALHDVGLDLLAHRARAQIVQAERQIDRLVTVARRPRTARGVITGAGRRVVENARSLCAVDAVLIRERVGADGAGQTVHDVLTDHTAVAARRIVGDIGRLQIGRVERRRAVIVADIVAGDQQAAAGIQILGQQCQAVTGGVVTAIQHTQVRRQRTNRYGIEVGCGGDIIRVTQVRQCDGDGFRGGGIVVDDQEVGDCGVQRRKATRLFFQPPGQGADAGVADDQPRRVRGNLPKGQCLVKLRRIVVQPAGGQQEGADGKVAAKHLDVADSDCPSLQPLRWHSAQARWCRSCARNRRGRRSAWWQPG